MQVAGIRSHVFSQIPPLLFSMSCIPELSVADVSRNSRKYSELHIPLPPASSFFFPSFLFFSFFFLHQRVTKGTISVTLRESSRERSRSFFRESFQRLEHTVDVCHAEERRTNRVTTNSSRSLFLHLSPFESKTTLACESSSLENIDRGLSLRSSKLSIGFSMGQGVARAGRKGWRRLEIRIYSQLNNGSHS